MKKILSVPIVFSEKRKLTEQVLPPQKKRDTILEQIKLRFSQVKPVSFELVQTLSDSQTTYLPSLDTPTEVGSDQSSQEDVFERSKSLNVLPVSDHRGVSLANAQLILVTNAMRYAVPKELATVRELPDLPKVPMSFLPQDPDSACLFQNEAFKAHNEDRVKKGRIDTPKESGRYYILCDGHGLKELFQDGKTGGELAAEFFVERIPQKFRELLIATEYKIEISMKRAFEQADLESQSTPWSLSAGTTAVFVYIPDKTQDDFQERYLHIAYVGDSCAVLCQDKFGYKATLDHDMQDLKETERNRILASGLPIKNERVISTKFGGLNMTRSLGNFGHAGHEGVTHVGHKGAVSGTPDIVTIPVQKADRLVLMSDGVSDVIDPSHVAKILRRHPNAYSAVNFMVELAIESGSKDNISGIVINDI